MFSSCLSKRFCGGKKDSYTPLCEYPVYIIAQVISFFQQNEIEVSFQTNLSILRKIKDTNQEKFFVVLIDSLAPKDLTADLKQENCTFDYYPIKNTLRGLLLNYKRFLSGSAINQQIAESQTQSRFKVKSIESPSPQKNKQNNLLLVLNTKQDDNNYSMFVESLRSRFFRSQKVIFLDTLERYSSFLKATKRNCILLLGIANIFETKKSANLIDEFILFAKEIPKDYSIEQYNFTYVSTEKYQLFTYIAKTYNIGDLPNQLEEFQESDYTASHISQLSIRSIDFEQSLPIKPSFMTDIQESSKIHLNANVLTAARFNPMAKKQKEKNYLQQKSRFKQKNSLMQQSQIKELQLSNISNLYLK